MVRRKDDPVLKQDYETFVENNKLNPPKCMSDQCELYIRYIFAKLRDSQLHHRYYDLAEQKVIWRDFYLDKSALSEAEVLAVAIIRELRGSDYVGGHSPKTIACAISYMGCVKHGVNVTQKEVSNLLGVSSTSMRKQYKIIRKMGRGLV